MYVFEEYLKYENIRTDRKKTSEGEHKRKKLIIQKQENNTYNNVTK